MKRPQILSGNALKLIAAAAMVCDHIGLLFFPQLIIFRIIGRLAFPIFAFMIAEGCRYTRSKLRHFLTMAILATAFQVVYFIATRQVNLSIFVTFSFSIVIIYCLQHFKKKLFDATASKSEKLFSLLLLFTVTLGVYVLDQFVKMDYDFAGCMVPVFTSLLHSDENTPERLKKSDTLPCNLLATSIGLILLVICNKPIQLFSLLTLPLLWLYSGKRGTPKLKYFFYIFYPAHLVLLYGIKLLLT